jgi:lipopolysaccharide transport system ATP-binding protein
LKPILEIQSISKKFRINHQRQEYLSLRDSIVSMLKRDSSKTEDFWALKDISFDVMPGESLGIIGKNGAGKSTLLKILSKITPPTSGKITSRGRIASLLEVGTGFHPELTGRENIFLNGSILGMKHKEIQKKFDEIVDFSGTEKFLDTPLKHYSSGMQLRLAFSVAAFLEPEIMVIDEVLAVGDVEFQKKCIGKMESVSKSGRTILFVSHNMAVLDTLCNRALLLHNGSVLKQGETHHIIDDYLNLYSASDSVITNGRLEVSKRDDTRKIIKAIEMIGNDKPTNSVMMGASVEVKVHFSAKEIIRQPVLGIVFKNHQGATVLGINNKHYVSQLSTKPLSEGCISMKIPYLQLMNGYYTLDFFLGDGMTDLENVKDVFKLNVEPKDFSGTGYLPSDKLNTFFMKDIQWKME